MRAKSRGQVTVRKVRAKRGEGKRQPAEGRRVWMSRGMKIAHHDKLRKIAGFIPKEGPWTSTMTNAHDLVMEAGLPIVMERLGIPLVEEPLPPAA